MKMGRKRRLFTDKFKAKVALETVKGCYQRYSIPTTVQFVSEGIYPNVLPSLWFQGLVQGKQSFLNNALDPFFNATPRGIREDLSNLFEELAGLQNSLLRGKPYGLPIGFPMAETQLCRKVFTSYLHCHFRREARVAHRADQIVQRGKLNADGIIRGNIEQGKVFRVGIVVADQVVE